MMRPVFWIAQRIHRARIRREHEAAMREVTRLCRICRMRQDMVRSASLKSVTSLNGSG